jgi:hypothetical protein
MSKFKAGDRVHLKDTYQPNYEPPFGFPSRYGTVLGIFGELSADIAWDGLQHGWKCDGVCNGWCVDTVHLEYAAPTVAADLRLKPQSKTILRHLKTHGHISPAKAQVVYGITRLAACIFDIRKVGYEITTTIRCDDQGHRYSYYEMAKAN